LYLSAKSSAGLPLELAARTSAGESVSFTFQTESGSGEAPRLLWSKTRIQRLLSEKQDAEAVQLSVASNLICRLTAFIAWDESEKVAISRHELVQPAMVPAAAGGVRSPVYCRQPQFIERITMPRFGEGLTGCYAGALQSAEHPQESVQIHTVHKLTAICQKIPGSDWHPPVQAIIQWLLQAGMVEFAAVEPEIQLLMLELRLCIDLIAAANGDENSLEQRVRLLRLQLGIILQRWKSDPVLAELEAAIDAVQSLSASTKSQQLKILKTQAQCAAVELLKRFTIQLPVQK
jgi:hypothetical protein